MKKLLCLAIPALLTLASCSKSNDDNSSPADPQLQGTKWVVTYYRDQDKDETSNFNGYAFEFKTDGSFVANVPDGSTKTGIWSTLNDDSANKLAISVAGTKPLDDLSDDWIIVEKTDTSMKLKDDNDTHLEEIHLKKI